MASLGKLGNNDSDVRFNGQNQNIDSVQFEVKAEGNKEHSPNENVIKDISTTTHILNYKPYDISKDDDSDDNPLPSSSTNSSLPLAPIHFSCGSFEDPYEYFGDADLVFVFSTCWTDDMMASLGKCIGRQCKPGTIAITTEFQIPLSGKIEKVESDDRLPCGEYEMELLDKVDGYCGVTGGVSTASIHRLVKSPSR